MPTRPLPNDPSFEHLRKEAKRLRAAVHAGHAEALAQVQEFHPRPGHRIARFALSDAQLVIARSYGFASWPKLKQHLNEIAPFVWNTPVPEGPRSLVDQFVRRACLVYGDWHRSNPARARRLLEAHPELATANVSTAAAAGDVASVRAMIERDPSLVNAKGGPLHWEPLLYACYSRLEGDDRGHSTLEVARLLLGHGADPNAGFLWGGSYPCTGLTGAFGKGEDGINELPHPQSLALAGVLLEAGADPNDSQTLYNRHFEENDDHLKLLFAYGLGQDTRGPWIDRLGDRLNSPSVMLVQELCWAAQHNFPERVRLLVEHGVDVNTRGHRDGRTPYQEALRAGNHAIGEYLLQHGAQKIDLDPVEAFAVACIEGRRDVVFARLAKDPALWEKLGKRGRADMLHRAVGAKRVDGVRLIVELGGDVNEIIADSGLDRSALHAAAGWAGLDMVKLLLESGADPHLRDPTYHAASIGWAVYGQQQEVVNYLLTIANIFEAVQCGGVERVAALLEQDPSLANATDEDGNALVFYLHPEVGRLNEMLALLTAHGADLNARGTGGKTILDRAIARGWSEFAEVLRSHGAETPAEREETE